MIYIAMLRGINAGGQKKIKMKDLAIIFEKLNYRNVETYVQSGNVIFKNDNNGPAELAGKIEKAVAEKFGFEVKIFVRTSAELEKIITGNPFLKNPGIDSDKLHVTFLLDKPDEKTISELTMKKEDNELFLIKNMEVYLYCPNGYGRTRLNNQSFEKKLKTLATTRNWKTVNALYDISRKK